jgi:hypothetical protein
MSTAELLDELNRRTKSRLAFRDILLAGYGLARDDCLF